MATWRRVFRLHLSGGTVEQDIDDEITFHLEAKIDDLIEEGMPPHLAREEAVRAFGDTERVRRACREIGRRRERGRHWTEAFAELSHDVVFALRQLKKAPAFAAIAVFTLALGIGATTAIFSLLDAVVLRPLPFAHPERLVFLWTTHQGEDRSTSPGNYLEIKRSLRSVEALAASQNASFNLLDGGGAPERIDGGQVTSNYFETFGLRPALGRTFTPAEDAPGRERVVVLSHRLWRERFGGNPHALGKVLHLNGLPYTVIGVMPEAFTLRATDSRLWVPLALPPDAATNYGNSYLTVRGRLRPGVTPEAAAAEIAGFLPRLRQLDPEANTDKGVRLEPYLDRLLGGYRKRLLILLGAVGCVLLIGCVNVANLLLARGAARSREIAIRAALGAGRRRIVRQLLTESLVLGLAGAALGILLAALGLKGLIAISPPGVPRLEAAEIDATAFACALALGLLATLLSGLVPALRSARPDLQGMLKEGGRSLGAGSPRDRVRMGLLITEVALALVLLAGAGLLIRSGVALQKVELGFDPAGTLTAQISLPEGEYKEPEQAVTAVERMVEELSRRPGIESAAAVSILPLSENDTYSRLTIESQPRRQGDEIHGSSREVTPGYFQTLGIPIVRGRELAASDRQGAPQVSIVNQTLARQAWPGLDPVGQRFAYTGDDTGPDWIEVVGVVGDVRLGTLDAEVRPAFYIPMMQSRLPKEEISMALVARSAGDPASLAPALRSAVHEINPRLPVYDVATFEQIRSYTTATERFNRLMLTALGIIGLLLSVVGIYGVIAWFVSQRTQEIGLRMALGATQGRVLAMVTWQAFQPVLAGLALGIVFAFLATRLLSGLLFGVTATDPVTFVGVLLLLASAALVASLVPASRAARVDPTRALSP